MIDVIMQHDSVRGPVLLPRTRAPHHGNGNAYPSSQVGLGPVHSRLLLQRYPNRVRLWACR
jgi:hypothetical protein